VDCECEESLATEEQRREKEVTKLAVAGYESLPPGLYVLEVLKAETINRYSPQLKLQLRVFEGERQVFELARGHFGGQRKEGVG
jgi:hypothetical protein